MALSEQEQRMLDEIESALYAEDPKFTSTMTGHAFGGRSAGAPRGVTIQAVAIAVLGLVLLLGGVALAQMSLWFIALSVVGFIAMFAAGVWSLGTAPGDGAGPAPRRGRGGRGGRGGGGRGPRPPRSPRGGGSGPGSLESRFRNRFEQG
ncbi:hypothetical protein CSPHI_07885 [Corynebacterium sphenisci DSM 44792]|uniref:DUF3040 domain-containing protein n=1 Tax=Corynebacterium sphenisci DSM 44792 TaxID=1437874 RepID=A0A1L7CYR3_9CORY|nr:DUF3040 domain-containing protein [Corynebacterium sphenisci]APT90967.1 hypothetical protein CSPHI_07885 [Corynebacterium sphenisci DSM 44792]